MGGQVADLLVEEFGGLAEELVYGFLVALLRLFGSVIHFFGLFRSPVHRLFWSPVLRPSRGVLFSASRRVTLRPGGRLI